MTTMEEVTMMNCQKGDGRDDVNGDVRGDVDGDDDIDDDGTCDVVKLYVKSIDVL